MQILKPLVDELGKKFPKQEDAMKKQQATMDLYKRAGVESDGRLSANASAVPDPVCHVQVFPGFN